MWKMDWKGAKHSDKDCGSHVLRKGKLNLANATADTEKWVDSGYLGDKVEKT